MDTSWLRSNQIVVETDAAPSPLFNPDYIREDSASILVQPDLMQKTILTNAIVSSPADSAE